MQPNGVAVSEVIHALVKRDFERIELGRYYGIPRYAGATEFWDLRSARVQIPRSLCHRPRFLRYERDNERETLPRGLGKHKQGIGCCR